MISRMCQRREAPTPQAANILMNPGELYSSKAASVPGLVKM